MMTDPIADMLTQIRNSISAGLDRVEFHSSKIKAGICTFLKEEGYI
jgi:small subunit ribosomal protein S8